MCAGKVTRQLKSCQPVLAGLRGVHGWNAERNVCLYPAVQTTWKSVRDTGQSVGFEGDAGTCGVYRRSTKVTSPEDLADEECFQNLG